MPLGREGLSRRGGRTANAPVLKRCVSATWKQMARFHAPFGAGLSLWGPSNSLPFSRARSRANRCAARCGIRGCLVGPWLICNSRRPVTSFWPRQTGVYHASSQPGEYSRRPWASVALVSIGLLLANTFWIRRGPDGPRPVAPVDMCRFVFLAHLSSRRR